jgi:fatty-acyl-CoA synthase
MTLKVPPTHPSRQLSTVTRDLGAVDIALRALRRYSDRIAFRSASGDLTYAGTLELIGRLQHVLAGRGVRRGDRVAMLSSNRAEFWCASTAVQGLGAAASFLHPLASLDDQLLQIADLDASLCIVDMTVFEGRAGELAARLGDVPVLGISRSASFPDLLSEAAQAVGSTARDVSRAEDVALVNYTGGTTGRAKGVVRRKTPAAYQLAITTLADFEISSGASYLAVAPITHVAGAKVIPVLARGGSIHLQQGFDPEAVLRAIERERISMTLMVPTMIYTLLDHPKLDDTDLSSLELLLYGASPIASARLREGLDRIGPVFSQLYGQTECYPIAVLSREDHRDPSLMGKCGAPGSTIDCAVLDDESNPVDAGEVGEICVRGPSMMDEYWRRPDLTREAFVDGWLRTGDLGCFDERGYLAIVDRAKDLVISGGFNVYPSEVENVLVSHPAVSSAAVFGVDHERWGEAVTAAVVLRPGASALEQELIEFVRDRKGSLLTPKTLRVVENLPMTPVGKIDKRRLRREWATEES